MKKLLFLFLAIGVLVKCTPDDELTTASLDLNVKLVYDGQPLSMFNNVTYPDGQMMNFSRVSMYLSSFTIKGSDDHTLFDLEYFNYTASHDSQEKAKDGYTVSFANVPVGDYTGVSFDLGVPQEDNAKTPADFDNTSDLSNQAEYWGGWKSYVFTKTEGMIDSNNDGEMTGFSIHTGSDEVFKSVSLTKPFAVIADGTTTSSMTMTIDLKKVFGAGGEVYDIIGHPQTHSLSQQAQINQISTNYSNAFTIE